jgi:NAD-dependent deacetylase
MSNLAAAEIREQTWRTLTDHPGWHAQPNDARRALVTLECAGKLRDPHPEHRSAAPERGSASDLVLELHRTCSSFTAPCSIGLPVLRRPAGDTRRVGASPRRETGPPCDRCGGILKSATISFGQSLDRAVLDQAQIAARSCDLMLAAGSSLTVLPAAGLVGLAAEVLRGTLDGVLPAIVS